jgi:hypothetical protein
MQPNLSNCGESEAMCGVARHAEFRTNCLSFAADYGIFASATVAADFLQKFHNVKLGIHGMLH